MDFDPLVWMFRFVDLEPFTWHLHEQKVFNRFTETDRISFFQTLHAWFKHVTRTTGTIDRFYTIGDHIICLSFASEAMVAQITPAIAHLETAHTEQPALTICLWDNASTQTELPGLMPIFIRLCHWYWHEYLDPRQNVKPLCSDRFYSRLNLGANVFSSLDTTQNLALYWIEDVAQLPYWEKGSPLQAILNWWTSAHQRQYVHAAAVGTATGGVLLAAKGGSGKSTSALACLNSALTYVSDDYCLVATDSVPYVYSLYNSAKLKGAIDLERFPHLAPLLSNGNRLSEEKAMIFLQQHFPEKVVAGFPIRAILVPQITGKQDTKLTKSTAIAALKALAPSTLFQLSGAGQSSFQMMSDLVKQVPCYTLELGTDITQIPQVILEFLNSSESSHSNFEKDVVVSKLA